MSPDVEKFLKDRLAEADERVRDIQAELDHRNAVTAAVEERLKSAIKWRSELSLFINRPEASS